MLALIALIPALGARADEAAPPSYAGFQPTEQLLSLLPHNVSEGLDVHAWAWFSFLHSDQEHGNYTDTVLSLDVSKTFAQRVTVSAEGNYMNADGHWRGEAEQVFISILALEETRTILTLGKFNANFGLEGRDFWSRTHGTTSLLFGAQPQDLIGAMISQPIGETGLKLRGFLSLDFQGHPEINQSPAAGLQLEYKPDSDLHFSWTNWVGPGMVMYGGRPIHHPYPHGGYGSTYDEEDEHYGNATALENWQGPNLFAERGGTLYFTDANVSWRPRNDLTLGAEFLLGTSGTSLGRWGWSGFMLTADFNVTDRLALFARYSYIDDADWLLYGKFEKIWEASAGASYHLTDHLEFRGEYRHDRGTESGSMDSVSVHVTVGF